MATPTQFWHLIDTMMDTLKNQPLMKWNLRSFCKHLETVSPYKAVTIGIAVKALVRAGAIRGEIRGTNIVNIGYKANQNNGQQPSPTQNTGNGVSLEIYNEIQGQLEAMRDKYDKLFALAASDRIKAEETEKKLRDDLKKTVGNICKVQLCDGDKIVKTTEGLFHEKFSRICKLAEQRMNIFIYGPTGCGKTHICEQVAEALNLDFGFISCTAGMSEAVLTGRLLPIGKNGTFEFVTTDFIRCYENGGVFLFDEMDAADPNVLLIINSALANGYLSIPNRADKPFADRHPDFICVAAANTVGLGASRMYSGRNKLDGATLDRFAIGKVYMDYDQRVEEILCPVVELRDRLHHYRNNINVNKLERAMSTRFMKDAAKMHKAGWSYDEIDDAFFEGWREDEVKKVRTPVPTKVTASNLKVATSNGWTPVAGKGVNF